MPKKSGFTLIELLVVVSIIGILATLVLANLTAGRSRARDAQRKSDLRNIETALRLYYNDKGSYPNSDINKNIVGCGTLTTPSSCVWGETWATDTATYMQTLPKDPMGSDQEYRYTSDIANDTFTLEACFENKSDDKGTATSDTTWCPTGWEYIVRP